MIPILLAAALACPLCTPDGRMAMLAKVGAKSFDVLEAPGRTLIRAMASEDAGAPPPVITFVREANGAARVEAAGGRSLTAPVGPDVFAAATRVSGGLRDDGDAGPVCGRRSYSVQRREGLGAMSAIEGRACRGEVQQAAERLAALALASLPDCRTPVGPDPFDRLAACLRR